MNYLLHSFLQLPYPDISSATFSRKPPIFHKSDRPNLTANQNKGNVAIVIKVFSFSHNNLQKDSRATVVIFVMQTRNLQQRGQDESHRVHCNAWHNL
jgi:hypothetical protein